jgi:Lamin Tail Domain
MITRKTLRTALLGSALVTGGLMSNIASAAMLITEVNANGSGASYAADWFELTNTGPTAVTITGWKMDDNSNAFGSSVLLRGVTSVGAGQSVIFLEGLADGSTDATIQTNFKTAWFGSNVPAGLTLGNYGGSGVGLSNNNGDAVNLYNSTGTLMANVSFGAEAAGKTFDNAAGLNNASISQLSAVGVNGAFTSANAAEIGSPGVAPVPLPAAAWLLLSGLGLLGPMMRRRA